MASSSSPSDVRIDAWESSFQVFALLHTLVQPVVWTSYCIKVTSVRIELVANTDHHKPRCWDFFGRHFAHFQDGNGWLANNFGQTCSYEVWHSHLLMLASLFQMDMKRIVNASISKTSYVMDITCLDGRSQVSNHIGIAPQKRQHLHPSIGLSHVLCIWMLKLPSISLHSSWPLLFQIFWKWLLVVFLLLLHSLCYLWARIWLKPTNYVQRTGIHRYLLLLWRPFAPPPTWFFSTTSSRWLKNNRNLCGEHVDVSKNRGKTTQHGWFIMENPIKMGWFGGKTPLFLVQHPCRLGRVNKLKQVEVPTLPIQFSFVHTPDGRNPAPTLGCIKASIVK